MAEKKPGLLKKIFSFGFGKNAEEPEVEAPKELEAPQAEETQAEATRSADTPKAKKTQKAASKKAEAKKPAAKKEKSKTKTEKKPAAKKSKAKSEKPAEPEKAIVEVIEPETASPITDEAIKEAPKAAKEIKKEPSKTAIALTERKAPSKPEPEPEDKQDVETKKQGWLKRLTKGLSRSSEALTENITKVFTDKKLDDDTIQELEDILLQADLGIETAMKITDALSEQKFGKSVTDEEVREIMAEEIEKILAPVAVDLDLDLEHQPHVILMIGVNGSGKTTTIGKLGQKLYDAGFSTSLVAGDTFRAAAIEQLKIWGERTQSPVLFRELGADAAGLAYDAWENTRDDRRDVMLMDTAGRLQNKTELMQELEKIVRVLKKQDESAPHTVLLTLDATTGQNAMNQVEIFKEVAGVNGIVMTKLDGTARGGILVAIAAKYKLPVYFVGVGEGVDDLEPFEARDFARSIVGLPKEDE